MGSLSVRLQAPRLRLNNKLELFILASLFVPVSRQKCKKKTHLQGLKALECCGGRGYSNPNLRLSKIAAAVAAFFMIISSVACHVNFTYTSLHSFTTEGAAKRGRGTHTNTHTRMERSMVIICH